MRIGWVVPGYQGREDEPGIPALTGLAHELARRHDLHVYAARFPLRHEEYAVDGVPVTSFGIPPIGNRFQSRARSAARWAGVLHALQLAHRRAPFAVLHGFWATEAGMLAAMAGRLLGVPVVVSVCGGELASVRSAGYGNQLSRAERAQVSLSLHLADRIGVGSDDARSRLVARYPWLDSRITALPLGFDPSLFAPSHAAPLPGRLICVASWSAVKGHVLLLDAVRLLRERGSQVSLTLIGERTDGAAARHAIADRGLEEWVEVLGYQSQAEVAAAVSNARLSVITSWHEAQCLAVVESLARGVPVVSTPVGIARPLLRDPRLGAVVANRSPLRLAAALLQILEATAEESTSARLARAEAVAHLATPRLAPRFEAVYRGMARKKTSTAAGLQAQ